MFSLYVDMESLLQCKEARSILARFPILGSSEKEESNMFNLSTEEYQPIIKPMPVESICPAEVFALLETHSPTELILPKTGPVETENLKQKHLLENAHRIVARPIGQGVLNYMAGVEASSGLNLNAKFQLPSGPPLSVSIDLTLFPADALIWPEFHNGVASILGAKHIEGTRQFILSARQTMDQVLTSKRPVPGVAPELVFLCMHRHAGLLFALGLRGDLTCLRPEDCFRYLKLQNECISICVILGSAISKTKSAKQICFMHIPSVLPTVMEIPSLVTAAAIAGIGFVHANTMDVAISNLLMDQLRNARGPEREACALSAGLALGLVGHADDALLDRLMGTTSSNTEDEDSLCYELINNCGLPGTAVAVGLLYRGSGQVLFKLPKTVGELELDESRADSLLYKCLANGLTSPPSDNIWVWLKNQLPDFLQVPEKLEVFETRIAGSDVPSHLDWLGIYQATLFGLTGACVSLGVTYAGSRDLNVKNCLLKMLAKVTKLDYSPNHVAAQCASRPSPRMALDRSSLETCRAAVLLSLASVMSGSGDSAVWAQITLAREKLDEASSFGVAQAVNQAAGFLFMGRGQYCFNLEGDHRVKYASVLMAIMPRFPSSVSDNRFSLQALRHLYVLAVERKVDLPVPVSVSARGLGGAYISEFSTPRESDVRKMLGLSYSRGEEVFVGGVCMDWISQENRVSTMAALAFPGDLSERISACKNSIIDLGGIEFEMKLSEKYIDSLTSSDAVWETRLLKDCIFHGKEHWFFDLIGKPNANEVNRLKNIHGDLAIFERFIN